MKLLVEKKKWFVVVILYLQHADKQKTNYMYCYDCSLNGRPILSAKTPALFVSMFLILKYQCKNIICYGQHTAIPFVTFTTAHCFIVMFGAFTVEHGACDFPVVTAAFFATFTVRV